VRYVIISTIYTDDTPNTSLQTFYIITKNILIVSIQRCTQLLVYNKIQLLYHYSCYTSLQCKENTILHVTILECDIIKLSVHFFRHIYLTCCLFNVLHANLKLPYGLFTNNFPRQHIFTF